MLYTSIYLPSLCMYYNCRVNIHHSCSPPLPNDALDVGPAPPRCSLLSQPGHRHRRVRPPSAPSLLPSRSATHPAGTLRQRLCLVLPFPPTPKCRVFSNPRLDPCTLRRKLPFTRTAGATTVVARVSGKWQVQFPNVDLGPPTYPTMALASFKDVLHKSIYASLRDQKDEFWLNGAKQLQEGWMHIHGALCGEC